MLFFLPRIRRSIAYMDAPAGRCLQYHIMLVHTSPAVGRAGAKHARLTDAGVSSAQLERPKGEGIVGHRYCMRHICTYESARDVCGPFVGEYQTY